MISPLIFLFSLAKAQYPLYYVKESILNPHALMPVNLDMII